MKPATNRLARPVVEILRPADLRDQALVHDGDAVRHGQRLFLVVRDVDEGDAEIGVQAAHLELQVLAQLLVERAQRLVHQQQPGLEHDGAGQRDALLLAAGELARIAVAVARQLHQLERLADQLRPFGLARRRAASAGSRCSRPPSGAGTARSSGTPCRCCACAAASPTTDVPSIAMSPSVGVSKPAIIIRVVVLPEPLGPSSVRNSPERMSSDTPRTAPTPLVALLQAGQRHRGAAAGRRCTVSLSPAATC